MTDTPLLEGTGLSKRFAAARQPLWKSLRGAPKPEPFYALRDIDLAVAPGEVLAAVGRNGAGKSTLLKVCAGVTQATEGELRRPRRIAPLIEVGAGFHQDLTGRENVVINARLLGLSKAEAEARFDEIVDFAEMGHAIDREVRQYSSGMFMRLGFSVAIHTRPELLIVDEVLAVGDLPFQVRCMDRIRELRADGVGILFVSHNLTAVLSLSDRAMLIEKGQCLTSGSPNDVIGAYHRLLGDVGGGTQVGDDVGATGELELVSVTTTSDEGTAPVLWEPGQRATVELRLRASRDVPESFVGFRLLKDGVGTVASWMGRDAVRLPALREGEEGALRLSMSLNVGDGSYALSVALAPLAFDRLLFTTPELVRFGVGIRPGGGGLVDLDPTLVVDSREL